VGACEIADCQDGQKIRRQYGNFHHHETFPSHIKKATPKGRDGLRLT
jgi:hypothetical protein